ncbi:MAG: glycosyltransferase family 1 protein [Clostridia bacterium]|nr:glycosyltransferase family 1 protein [Clostridia bacterium]
MQPKRILLIVHEMNRGGIETLLMNIFRTIDREKIIFDFVVHVSEECDYDAEIKELGGIIYHCPDYKIWNHLLYKHWWKKFLAEHPDYDIIHSHLFTIAKVHLRIAKRMNRVTIVHSHISSRGSGIKAFIRRVYTTNINSCCDYKFACSKVAAEYLFGEQAENAYIIKNGIIAKNYIYDEQTRIRIRESLGVADDEIVIGNVASINARKNQKFILDVLQVLLARGLKYRFVCLGKSHVGNAYEEYAAQLGVADKVHFVGVQSNVNEWLQAFDIYMMPSLYEGLPVAAVEAQAAGLRCLLSDTISAETDITGLVDFMSLETPKEQWAQTIINMTPYERKDMYATIAAAGYDIQTSTDWLTDFYLNLKNKKETK